MTTIVFDGSIFAVDTRCSTENRRETACVKCGDTSDRVNDDVQKISVYRPQTVKFKDEFVIATAGCGLLSTVKALNTSVRQMLNFDDADLWSSWMCYNESKATLVILTEQSLYTLTFHRKKFLITKREGSTFCAGSGRHAAALVLKMMDGNAIDAVAGAAQVDEGTGGEVRFIVKPPIGCEEELKILGSDIESTYQRLLKRIKPTRPVKVKVQ